MGSVSVLGKSNDDPHKTVPIPHCLRAASSTLCQCVRAGLLVAHGVCPGHFLGTFHMAPSERKVRAGPVNFINRRHERRGASSRKAGPVRSTSLRPRPDGTPPISRGSKAVEATRELVARTAIEPHPILASNDAEAVMLDLVQPLAAGGQRVGFGGEARRNEAGRKAGRHDAGINRRRWPRLEGPLGCVPMGITAIRQQPQHSRHIRQRCRVSSIRYCHDGRFQLRRAQGRAWPVSG